MTDVPDNTMVELARSNLLVLVIRETLAKLPPDVQAHVQAALRDAEARPEARTPMMQEAIRIAAQGLRLEIFGQERSGN